MKFAVMEYNKTFDDIQGNWAQAYIEDLASRHIINGQGSDHLFKPESAVTRAEFTAMMALALNLETEGYTGTFIDSAKGKWYTPYVEAAARAGIVHGTGNGEFAPEAEINRQALAKMSALAFAKYSGTELSDLGKLNRVYADLDAIDDWAVPYVEAVTRLGLMNGVPDGRFLPKESTKRNEAAAVIYLLLVELDLL
ncbi:S-layer homology domain-containing protein [Paenibacillus sp. JSM ZJ436]